jgi:hypothetical protein
MHASAQFRAKHRKRGKARRHALKINGSYLSNTPRLETTTRKIALIVTTMSVALLSYYGLEPCPVGKDADAGAAQVHSAAGSVSLPTQSYDPF